MSQRLYILSEDGERPVKCYDIIKWGEFFEDTEKRIVKQESIGEKWISTVFLGVDHGWGGGPPILWETMVFGARMKTWETDRCRGNRDQALAMHESMVARMKALEALET